MSQPINPSRLSLARKHRGLTKRGLAIELSVSPRMITAYEAGEKSPSPLTLAKAAEVLHFPIEFFSGEDLDEPPIEGTSFRALSRLTARVRDKALASGTLAMALSDWIHDRFKLPEASLPRYQGVDPETASMAVRAEWGLGERPTGNLLRLLEFHGVRVFSLMEDAVEMDAFSYWRGELPYIFLNTGKSAERNRMDMAHELGHLILHWQGGARGRRAENEANQFGSAFLMTRGSVYAEAPRNPRLVNLIKAKRKWNVALSNLTYRMHDLNLLSDWQYRMLFVEMGRKNYLVNEPNGSKAETSQVLAKVFKMLRDEGTTMSNVADALHIYTDDLSRLIFGLTLTAIDGQGKTTRNNAKLETNPSLRLV